MPRHESLLQRIIACCCPSAVEGTDTPTESFLASVQGQHPEMTPLPGPTPARAATPLSAPASEHSVARHAEAANAPAVAEVIRLPALPPANLPPPLCADVAAASSPQWAGSGAGECACGTSGAASASSSAAALMASPSEPIDVPAKGSINLFPAAGSKTASTLDSSPVVGSLEMYNSLIGMSMSESKEDLAGGYEG